MVCCCCDAVACRGLSVGNGCFAVWSGKHASVYMVDGQRRSCEQMGSFKCNAKSIRISDTRFVNDEVLFAIENENVNVLNFGGVQRYSLSFTEAEGVPELIDLKQRYLIIITNKGIIKVSRFDLMQSPCIYQTNT